MEQVFGRALLDYYHNTSPAPLFLHNNYGSTEEMPVGVFFRGPEEFPELESHALSLCCGRILDVGAGAGSHALFLQSQGKEVYALEKCRAACDIMRSRGVERVIGADFFDFASNGTVDNNEIVNHYRIENTGHKHFYDTLLFMMNGIGLAENLENVVLLLEHCHTLLKPGGQILFDSSDLNYLYQDGSISRPAGYYGEVGFQYEYKGIKGPPFGWVYVDPETMASIARASGWDMQILFDDGEDQYLARLV